MKFTVELPIHKPRAEVWNLFDNPENLNKWQPTLISFDPVSGLTGQIGAVSKLTFEENGRQFSLTEKIVFRDEPQRLDQLYENNFADNTVRNTFVEQDNNQTLWLVETEYKFKTLIMRILGPIVKKNFVARTQKDMERFKEMVESQ